MAKLKRFATKEDNLVKVLSPLSVSKIADGKSYIYSDFNPKYDQMAITILRTYYNFCFAFKFNETTKTPAQLSGITGKKFDLIDIILKGG